MRHEKCEKCGRNIDKLSPFQALLAGACFLINGLLLYPYWQPSRALVDAGAGKHIFFIGFGMTVGGFVIARSLAKQAPSMAGKVMLTIAGVLWMLSGIGVLAHLTRLAWGGS